MADLVLVEFIEEEECQLMIAHQLLLELMEEQKRGLRRERVIRDRTNPLEFPDHIFEANYRLPRQLILRICDELRPDLTAQTNRGLPIPVETQVLVCLAFLATGHIQRATGLDLHHQIHQSTVSRTVARVLDAILSRLHRYVAFPSSLDELQAIKLGFNAIQSITGIIGAIDCTHIPIMRPTTPDWHVFKNRKGYFSINVQIICDADMRILNIVARWPGSTSNSSIWSSCELREQISTEKVPRDGYLIGDTGYPLEPWLMTPIPEPTNTLEEAYNVCHRSTTDLVERCISRFKSTWRAMGWYGGPLLYRPRKVCKMAIVCGILHNIGINHRVSLPDDTGDSEGHPEPVIEADDANVDLEDEPEFIDPNLMAHGDRIRTELIKSLMTTNKVKF